MYINFEFVMVTTQILETYVSVFGFKRQVEQGISSFCAHFFWHIWWFFKVERTKVTARLCKIIKYDKMKKSLCSNYPKTNFSGTRPVTSLWFSQITYLVGNVASHMSLKYIMHDWPFSNFEKKKKIVVTCMTGLVYSLLILTFCFIWTCVLYIMYIYLWVPANADLVKIKGLNWLLALFKCPAWVPITYKCPYMLCSSLCSTPLTCRISFGIVTSGPLNTLGSFISFHVKRSKVEP